MVNPEANSTAITGVILAGGQARRMGGEDKGLIELAGSFMIQHVIKTLCQQVGRIIINANRNQEKYASFGYEVVADMIDGYCGPLAGMASAMHVVQTPYIVTTPCDSPFIPSDLVSRLYQQLTESGAEISVAHNGERMQPVFAMLNRDLLPSLMDYLNRGERKIDLWYARHKFTLTDFSDRRDTFLNINTPDDIRAIETRFTSTRIA